MGVDGWYVVARVMRKLFSCLSYNSNSGLFFRHRFNLKPDNPLHACGDWRGRDGPWQSNSPISSPVSVNRAFLLLSTHQPMPIILFFSLLALLPDAEVLWSQVYPSQQSNVSLICRDASRFFSHAPSPVQAAWHFAPAVLWHMSPVPAPRSHQPGWVDTRCCCHNPSQMFLNQTG